MTRESSSPPHSPSTAAFRFAFIRKTRERSGMSDHAIPSDAIEGLLKKVFIDQTVDTGLFWDALLNSRLYVPIAKPDNESLDVSSEGLEEFPMLLGVDEEGVNVVWIFTSPTAMTDYTGQDLRYLEISAKTLLTNLRGNEHDVVLIGPGGVVLSLHPDLIESLADGRVPEKTDQDIRYISKNTKIFAGPPPKECEAFEEPFRRVFMEHPEVAEAQFLEIRDATGTRLLLGLRLEDENREKLKTIAVLIGKAAEGVLERGKTMDITLINGSLKEAFEKHGKTFYKK